MKVHNGIYASAVGSIKRCIDEVAFAVVHPNRTAQFADALDALLAGSCENSHCAERVRKYDCRGTNTACCCMDKRPSARSQFPRWISASCAVTKTSGIAAAAAKESRSGTAVPSRGHRSGTSRRSAHINHLVGDFQTGNDRVAEVWLFSVVSLSLENVGAIQPGCADADQDIVWSQSRNRFFHQLDHACIACV
jgi:hypothetical protein